MQIEIQGKIAAEKTLKQYNTRLEVFDKIYRGIISAKSIEEIIAETLTQFPIFIHFYRFGGSSN